MLRRNFKRDPNVGGSLTLKWTIAPNGRVIEAQVLKRDFESPALEKCVLIELKAAKFPSALLVK